MKLTMMNFVAVCAVIGCTTPERSSRQPGDSVAVVTHSDAPAWKAGEEWRLSNEPSLWIQSDSTNSPLLGIRGPIQSVDGDLILANAASHDLRIFDSLGTLKLISGRQGDGPGEFPAGPFGLFACGRDTLVAKENRRVSLWHTSGRHIGVLSTQLGNTDRLRNVVGVSSDCSMILTEVGNPNIPNDPIVRAESRLLWYKRDGATRDTLIGFGGPEGIQVSYQGRQFRTRVPWTTSPVYAVKDSFLIFGAASEPVIRYIAPDGVVRRVISWKTTSRPVSHSDHKMFNDRRAAYIEAHPDERRNYPPLELLSPRTEKPQYSAALADSDGNLWVREYPDEDAGLPGFFGGHPATVNIHWQVFSPEGRWLGNVPIPAPLTVRQITKTKVIGIWRDDDDVESVRVYQLLKVKR